MRKMLSSLLYDRIMPFIDKYDEMLYLSDFRDTITSIGFPLLLTGSIFYIAANPPLGTSSSLINIWLSAAVQIREQLLVVYYFTWGMVSAVTALSFSFKLSWRLGMEPLIPSIMSFLSYLCITMAGMAGKSITIKSISESTGPNGMFLAYIISIAVVSIIKILNDKKLYFDVQKGTEPSASTGLKNILPVMIIPPAMWITSCILGNPISDVVSSVLLHIESIPPTLARDVVRSIAASISYWLGIDGWVVPRPLYSIFMDIGGFGSLLPLILLFILSCSRQLKLVGKTTLIPAFFNIPLPVIFAVPLIMNPIYIIPFILCPVINTLLCYLAVSSGFLNISMVASHTMPFIFSGIFAGQGAGLIVELLNFAVSMIIYYPFFRFHEKMLVHFYGTRKEKDAADMPMPGRIKDIFVSSSMKRERFL